MNSILGKLKDFVGLNEAEEYEEYEYEEMDGNDHQNSYQQEHSPVAREEEYRGSRRHQGKSNLTEEATMESNTRSNVIGMPGVNNGISEVVVFEPRSFEEMPQVIQALRERRSVVLNLNVMDPDEAQRAVDFVAGGTYAIDGHQERIGESIFLFTPSCVQVSTQSGVLQVAPKPTQKSPAHQTAPTAWAPEASRIAQ